MCGVAGLLYKGSSQGGPVGRILVDLLEALGSRGTDGTGVALYGNRSDGLLLRVWLGEGGPQAQALTDQVVAALKPLAHVDEATVEVDYARLKIRAGDGPEPGSQAAWIVKI
ncbi:MAG: hypothetical protein JWO42_2823, partial [Chloroflexi bacterium]|nr:hypothetical protein [Chloroflexota bacterium]